MSQLYWNRIKASKAASNPSEQQQHVLHHRSQSTRDCLLHRVEDCQCGDLDPAQHCRRLCSLWRHAILHERRPRKHPGTRRRRRQLHQPDLVRQLAQCDPQLRALWRRQRRSSLGRRFRLIRLQRPARQDPRVLSDDGWEHPRSNVLPDSGMGRRSDGYRSRPARGAYLSVLRFGHDWDWNRLGELAECGGTVDRALDHQCHRRRGDLEHSCGYLDLRLHVGRMFSSGPYVLVVTCFEI
ncbi:hypothetical protein C8F01DRAFT_1294029 [Mycena amicta]|nr:hypothetical protein C8F01DRAFT_1294029 [Mycena amicta]